MFWDQIQEQANNLIKPFMGDVDDDLLGACVTLEIERNQGG